MEHLKEVSSEILIHSKLLKSTLNDYYLFCRVTPLPITTDSLRSLLRNGKLKPHEEYTVCIIAWIKEILKICHQIEAIGYMVELYNHHDELEEIQFNYHDVLLLYEDLYSLKYSSVIEKCFHLINVALHLKLRRNNLKFYNIMNNLFNIMDKIDAKNDITECLNSIYELTLLYKKFRNDVCHNYSDTNEWQSKIDLLGSCIDLANSEQNKKNFTVLREITCRQMKHNFIKFHKIDASRMMKAVLSLLDKMTYYYEYAKQEFQKVEPKASSKTN